MADANVWSVAWIALATALATGLGALPFVFVPHVGSRWIGRGDALAAGLMLGAVGGLVVAGADVDVAVTLVGLALGAALVAVGSWASERSSDQSSEQARGRHTGIVLMSVMTLHSCAEGIAVGVAFAGDGRIGISTAIAIAVHNIPEGLAISLVLIPAGATVGRAAFMSILSSLPQPLFAVPAFLLVSTRSTLLPWGFGLAAGAMLWMVFGRLLVDAQREAPRAEVVSIAALGVGSMVTLQLVVG